MDSGHCHACTTAILTVQEAFKLADVQGLCETFICAEAVNAWVFRMLQAAIMETPGPRRTSAAPSEDEEVTPVCHLCHLTGPSIIKMHSSARSRATAKMQCYVLACNLQ